MVTFDPSGIRPAIDTPGRNPLPPDPSLAAGVGQPANTAAWFSVMFGVVKFCPGMRSASVLVVVGQPDKATVFRLLSLFPAALLPFCAGVPAIGAGHPASHATRPSSEFSGTFAWNPPSFQSRVVGVGHPVVPVPDVRRTDARRRERDTPEGVTQGFQVSVYKVDPIVDSFACNLLSNDDCRLALGDEVVEGGPQVPLISEPCSCTSRAERLARAAPRPYWSVVGPASKS